MKVYVGMIQGEMSRKMGKLTSKTSRRRITLIGKQKTIKMRKQKNKEDNGRGLKSAV